VVNRNAARVTPQQSCKLSCRCRWSRQRVFKSVDPQRSRRLAWVVCCQAGQNAVFVIQQVCPFIRCRHLRCEFVRIMAGSCISSRCVHKRRHQINCTRKVEARYNLGMQILTRHGRLHYSFYLNTLSW